MSTSLLYHGFGIRGYHYTRTDFGDGRVTFGIRQDPSTCRCSACGSADVIHRGEVPRNFLSVPIGAKPTTVTLRVSRVECRRCGVARQVKLRFTDPRRTYTRAFER